MNLTNQELNNDDRNAEAAELVRDFANLFRFISSTSSSSSYGSSSVLMVMIEVLTATVKV
jgi:hypothetical protein